MSAVAAMMSVAGASSGGSLPLPTLDLNFDGQTSSFKRASAVAAKTSGDQLATGIVTQNKGGTVRSKYMGPDGKLISGYVVNKSPSRNPANTNFVGAGGVTSPTETTGLTAPDGSNAAVKYTTTQDGSYYGRDNTTPVSFTQGENYTLSAYFKVLSGSVSVGVLMDSKAFGGATATYERAQYLISSGGGAPALDTSRRSGGGDYGIQDVGGGWYRIWVSAQANFTARLTSPTTGTNNHVFRVEDTVVGDEVLIWGLQFEEGVRVPSQFIDATADQVARVEYDANGNPLGLLVEEERTNYVKYSAVLNNATWQPAGNGTTTVNANVTTAPDGTTKADRVNVGNTGFIYQTVSGLTASTQYTASWFVKADSATAYVYGFYNQSSPGWITRVQYDPTTGEDFGNGWYRFSANVTTPSGCTSMRVFPLRHNTSSGSITGADGSSYIWGVQLEKGSAATSYMPTGNSTATRQADDISLATSNFGYDNATGTTVIDASVASKTAGANFPGLFEYQGPTNSDRIFVRSGEYVVPSVLDFQFRNGGTAADTVAINSLTWPYSVKLGVAHSGTEARHAVDGVLGTVTTIPQMTNAHTILQVGARASNPLNTLNGHIRRLRYWPSALGNNLLKKASV